MLKLPGDWRIYTGGAVANKLLVQVRGRTLQVEFSRHLISASFDLDLAARSQKAHAPPGVETRSELVWGIGDLRYLLLPVIDDDALETCVGAVSEPGEIVLIVPADHDMLVRQALKGALGRRSPTVFSFEDFISWRTVFASADAHWSRAETLIGLFSRYNQRAVKASLDESMLVDIPSGLD